jgi:hypothetical protein
MGSTAMTTAIPLKKLFSKFYAEGEGRWHHVPGC